MNPSRLLEHLLSAAVAVLFLFAAGPKIAEPAAFAEVIHAYQLTPDAAVNVLAVFFPWWELVAALAALCVPWRRAGLWLCVAMLVLFTGAQVINLQRGVKGSCGCFGKESKPISWSGVAFNGAFLAAAAGALILHGRNRRDAPAP
jgi:hypothetical protein